VLDASLILAVTAVASRLLGWVRLVVIGSQFGASKELDAYFAAFLIPDAIFQMVVAGALFTALVPVFVSYRARDQEEEAWRVASSVVNILVLGLAGVALLMAIFAPVLVPFVAPGFDAPTTALTVRLTRIMLLSPIFIGFGAVVTGILNTYDRWAVPAMAPLVYNLSIIFAAIFVAPILGVEALAVGVAVGSLLHLAIQLPEPGSRRAAVRPDAGAAPSRCAPSCIAHRSPHARAGRRADQPDRVDGAGQRSGAGQRGRLQLRLPAVDDPRWGGWRQHRGGPLPDPLRATPRSAG